MNKYEKQLGNNFNLASFHDEILKDGALPLNVLGNKIEMTGQTVVILKSNYIMKEQNLKNHSRYIPLWHFIIPFFMLVLLIFAV